MFAVPNSRSGLVDALAATLILAVGMGFGRFAYTGMYPLMVRDGLLTVSTGSMAASANYAGYLVGALLISRSPAAMSSLLARIALAGTVLCLALLSLDFSPVAVSIIRFAAGVVSAIAMVSASAWLFQVVGNTRGAPLLYAGVGTGIMISAELIAAANTIALQSHRLWMLLALAAAVLSIPAWLAVGRFPSVSRPPATLQPAASLPGGESPGPWSLIVMYGLAGFGYIITATYLPLFVRSAVGQVDPIHIWAAFGMGAAPSCFLWHSLHSRMGTRYALSLNLVVQAAGVLLPATSQSPLIYLTSALLVGGTFMGTVTIAMPAARRVAAAVRFNIFATMTAAYGVGQIAGPLLSDTLYNKTQSFGPSLYTASAALVIGALICINARNA